MEYRKCEADHPRPSSAEADNGGVMPPITYISSQHSAYLSKQRENFTSRSTL
jgi:hypothetical protein